jgi:hypothetical protein
MQPELGPFVRDFAHALKAVDHRSPQAKGRRGRVYQPGIGPCGEAEAVSAIVAELRERFPDVYGTIRTRVPYPGSRQTCDLCLGAPVSWAIEVKMARPNGDNGKPDPAWTKDVLSPYDVDRSAVADSRKLLKSGFPGTKAILIYGFDDATRPLERVIQAFEVLASLDVELGLRQQADFRDLVHPVHRSGKVFAWEVKRKSSPP